MKAVVTGGAGFIGSHLVDLLLEEGHEVAVLDDFSNGRRENLAAHEQEDRFSLHEVDITLGEALAPHFSKVNWVFHLAGLADIVPSVENPQRYFKANVQGTLSVAEACRRAGVSRLVYAASSSCYGLAKQTPTPETAPIQPQYPYALTKALGEEIILHWARVYGLGTVSLRLFNVFGPRSRTSGSYGAVLGVFLAQRLAGKPLTVVGDGGQTRDFTFVSDAARAFLAAALSAASGKIFNVGSGRTHSVNRLAELIGGETVSIPKRPGEPACTFADISNIRKELGWEPAVSFEEGVARTLEHIDSWKEAPVWTPDSIAEATKAWFAHLEARETQRQ